MYSWADNLPLSRKELRIGIDARALARGKGGVCSYVINIVRAFGAANTGHTFVLFAHRPVDMALVPDRMELVVDPSAFGTWWLLRRLPRLLERHRIDLAWFPEQIVPGRCPGVFSVATVHDLVPLVMPGFHALRERAIFCALTRTLARADAIVAVSENTRRDVLRTVRGVHPETVQVVGEGAAGGFRPFPRQEALQLVCRRTGICRPFILFVGTFEPRKNIERLVCAFDQLRSAGIDRDLVLIGKRGWKYDRIFSAVAKSPFGRNIHCLHDIDTAELPAFYNAADCFVFPSLYEGFGLPPLEAMSCGAPVVVADSSSLPEVVGDAGVRCDPLSVESIAHGIRRILEDPQLRKMCRDRGLKQAGRFSWNASAIQLLALFERLANKEPA